MSLAELANGPATEAIPGEPALPELVKSPFGILFDVGLNPNVPQHNAGMRTDPPMSVPTPSGEPRMAIRAPSPPLLPPLVRLRL